MVGKDGNGEYPAGKSDRLNEATRDTYGLCDCQPSSGKPAPPSDGHRNRDESERSGEHHPPQREYLALLSSETCQDGSSRLTQDLRIVKNSG